MKPPEPFDPNTEPGESGTRAFIRMMVLFVIVLVLPLLLIAATIHPAGCGGG